MLKRLLRGLKHSGKAYSTIDDCPVRIWFKIHRTGDLSLLVIEGKVEGLDKIWESMHDDYIERYGLPDSFKKQLSDNKNLAKMKAEYIISGQKHLKTMIAVKTEEIKRKVEIEEPEQIDSILARISKWYGFSINSSISVSQYYAYIKEIKNG